MQQFNRPSWAGAGNGYDRISAESHSRVFWEIAENFTA